MTEMKQGLDWQKVCLLDQIQPNTGVCALIGEQQVAMFRVGNEKRIYALSNHDPFSGANVMSRGILGDILGVFWCVLASIWGVKWCEKCGFVSVSGTFVWFCVGFRVF